MTEVVVLYSNDIPSSELFMHDLTRWKLKYLAKAESDQTSSCAGALNECDKYLFPNILLSTEDSMHLTCDVM